MPLFEKNRKHERLNIESNSGKRLRKAPLFTIVMVFVTCVIGVYKTRLFIKGFLNFEIMEVLQPVDHNITQTLGVTKRNSKYSGYEMNNKVKNRKKSCFYLSRKKTRALSITDFYVNFKEADTKLKINQHSTVITEKTKPCIRVLTVGTFGGRMGNHMFRIASMLGEAYRSDIIPVIPKESLLNKYIDLPNVVDTAGKMLHNVCLCESKYPGHCIKKFENTSCNIILSGQMQSWKYFDDIRHIITSAFKIKRVHIINAKSFIKNVTSNNFKNVCIHVRRGDFLSTRHKTKGFAVANESYIERAKKFFVQSYSRVQFISLSIDKEWCRKNIKDAIMSPFTDAGDDMALMSLCDHVIVTSGTFGWWGAWLSGGTTVYFKGYPAPGSYLERKVPTHDYYPNKWIVPTRKGSNKIGGTKYTRRPCVVKWMVTVKKNMYEISFNSHEETVH